MPGVTTTTTSLAGGQNPPRVLSSRAFVAGLADRGPTAVATKVASYADFVDRFGDPQAYSALHDQLRTAFDEGATEIFVTRVVGPTATKGSKTLVDRAGTPVNTIRVDAIGEGASSANVTVAVADGNITNTVTVTVTLGTKSEVFRDIGPDPQAICDAVNRTSVLVTAVNLASATAAPGNRPAVTAAGALSAGTDDRASVTAAVATQKLIDATPIDLGPGALAVPGYGSGSAQILLNHAAATNREAFFDDSSGASTGTVKGSATSLRAMGNAHYGALFYPWILIPDGAGGTKAVSPLGYVLGVRARLYERVGVWAWPAGEPAEARGVRGIVGTLSKEQGDDLTAANINPIRVIGTIPRLYGWRSLSPDPARYYSLAVQATLNALAHEGAQLLEQVLFRPIVTGGGTEKYAQALLAGMCKRYADAGGLYALGDDKGYTVAVTATPAQRRLDAAITVRIAEAAESITLAITRVAADSAL